MNETTRTQITALEDMRLPELWARYAEVLGETTRCPNRTYLIRRITEALEAGTSEPPEPTGTPAQDLDAPGTSLAAADTPAEAPATEPLPSRGNHCEACGSRLEDSRCTECEARTTEDEQATDDGPAAAEETGEPAEETMGFAEEAEAEPDAILTAGTQDAEPTAAQPAVPVPAVKLSKLTVPELQERLFELTQRRSGSSDVGYLRWKVRQAEKGKIPFGPRRQRATSAEPQDHKVLPLRMDATLVAQLDQARERLGLKSRMALFRAALNSYLAAAGEQEVAELFAPEN